MGRFFRLVSPTIAVHVVEGQPFALLIPPGSVIRVQGEALSDNRMLQVDWQDKLLMIFKIDLDERGEEVRAAHR